MRKRSLSLIEMVISLGLLTLLLSSLFYWYQALTKQKHTFQKLKEPIVEERYARQRLSSILAEAELPLFSSVKGDNFVFIFDRGVTSQIDLAGKVLARLFFDPKREALYLSVWPHPESGKQHPCQTTCILDHVLTCTFSFYSPPDPFKIVNPEQVGHSRPHAGWQKEWKDDYHTLPALIKIKITRDPKKGIKNHEFEYVFDLPIPIIYPQERIA